MGSIAAPAPSSLGSRSGDVSAEDQPGDPDGPEAVEHWLPLLCQHGPGAPSASTFCAVEISFGSSFLRWDRSCRRPHPRRDHWDGSGRREEPSHHQESITRPIASMAGSFLLASDRALALRNESLRSHPRQVPRGNVDGDRPRAALLAFEPGEEIVPVGADAKIRAEHLEQKLDRHHPSMMAPAEQGANASSRANSGRRLRPVQWLAAMQG